MTPAIVRAVAGCSAIASARRLSCASVESVGYSPQNELFDVGGQGIEDRIELLGQPVGREQQLLEDLRRLHIVSKTVEVQTLKIDLASGSRFSNVVDDVAGGVGRASLVSREQEKQAGTRRVRVERRISEQLADQIAGELEGVGICALQVADDNHRPSPGAQSSEQRSKSVKESEFIAKGARLCGIDRGWLKDCRKRPVEGFNDLFGQSVLLGPKDRLVRDVAVRMKASTARGWHPSIEYDGLWQPVCVADKLVRESVLADAAASTNQHRRAVVVRKPTLEGIELASSR